MLLKDSQPAHNALSMLRISTFFTGRDGRGRKVDLKTSDQDSVKFFQRPVSEEVLLLLKN